jgi:aconitate hydratase
LLPPRRLSLYKVRLDGAWSNTRDCPQLPDGETVESLGLTGPEEITVGDLENGEAKAVTVTATREGGDPIEFEARVRLDTPNEVRYYQNGGILHRVLRDLR